MSWRESYRPASFRGVPFHVESHSAGSGRRAAVHEFPGRDVPYTEDLGRKAREWTVDAYVVGEDYHADRDRLSEALEAAGPGELVHPYLGALSVIVTAVRLSESVGELRLAKFAITFTEAGQALFPAVAADPVRAVASAGAATMQAAGDGFLERFGTDGLASWVADAAAGDLVGLAGRLVALPVLPSGPAQTVAAWSASVLALPGNAAGLVAAPGSLVSSVLGIVTGIAAVFGTRAPTVYRSLRTSYAPRTPLAAGTPAAIQSDLNTRALGFLIRQAAVMEHATLAVTQAEQGGGFETRDEAVALRDELADALDVEQERPETTAGMYVALSAARAAVVRNIPAASLRLPRVVEYVPRVTVPSLVVAHALYGDAGRSTEIALRNRLRHPGFVPGGAPLQVLADG